MVEEREGERRIEVTEEEEEKGRKMAIHTNGIRYCKESE
jgi:hypothetical protein